MKKTLLIILILITLSAYCFAQETHKHDSKVDLKYVTEQVSVKGKIKNPMVLTVASLKKMNTMNGKDVKIICQSGEEKKDLKDFKGVLLRDILDSAGVLMDHKKDRGKFLVLVTASDNYKVIFSYNELYYGASGNHIFLVYEENGHEIMEEGKLIIFCSSDKVSGPRHIKWVQEIEIREIE